MVPWKTLLCVCAFGLLAPGVACAKQTTVWSFESGGAAGSWDTAGWSSAQILQDGLQVNTTTDGGMIRPTNLTHGIDTVRITFRSGPPSGTHLFLHFRGDAADNIRQLALISPFGWTEGNSLIADFTVLPIESGRIDQLGMGLPADTTAIIQRFEITGYNVFDKFLEAGKSFWTPDSFNGMTINFLWGPVLRTTAEGRSHIFQTIPPLGHSANLILICLLALSLLPLADVFVRKYGAFLTREKALLLFVGTCFGLWILYDIRMGYEFMASVRKDQQMFLDQPAGKKTFRTYDNFYDTLVSSVPYLREQDRFVFLHPADLPVESRASYFAYPSLPLRGDESAAGMRNWLVFRRPDVTVDDQGRLVQGEKILAKGGSIVLRFDSSSFLYQAEQ